MITFATEMQDPRVATAARNENRGPGWQRQAVITGRALRAASPHAYQPAVDATCTPHLARPGCKCGWSRAGYVRTWLADEMYERHALAEVDERRTPEPYDEPA